MTTDSILMTSPRPPLNRPHANAEDHQARFAAISARTPVDEDFREAFLCDKLFIAKTHSHLDISARNQAVASLACESAWNKNPVFGVIGIQSGPRGQRVQSGFHGGHGSRLGDAGSGDDRKDPASFFRAA